MHKLEKILIGTSNPFKAEKLAVIVNGFFDVHMAVDLPDVEEVGTSFREIAENKAMAYSKHFGGLAISTDGGANIPGLKGWNQLRTKRFVVGTDLERINRLLEAMHGVENRTVEWREALAVADRGSLVFSAAARAMDGAVSRSFDPAKYEKGQWLSSITEFPEFGGRNYYDLTVEEKDAVEGSWSKLKEAFKNRYEPMHDR